MSAQTIIPSHSRLPRRAMFGALALGGLLVAAGLPSARAASTHAPVSLTFWSPFSGPDGPAMQTIVNNFNKSQSNVHIAMTVNPNGNYTGALTTAISAKKAPDIFVVDIVAMATYADAGVLAPFTSSMLSKAGLKQSDFVPTLWAGGTYNKAQYALPMDALPLTLYWNKAVFKANGLNPNSPPTDEKTFMADAKKMTHGGTWGFIVPPNWPQQFIWPTLLAQFGGQEMNVGKQQVLFNSSAGMSALNLERSWIYTDKISPANAATDYDITALTGGKAGMIVDGPWQYSQLHKVLGANLGVGAVPQWGTKQGVFVGQHYFSMYKSTGQDSAKAASAMSFMQYFEAHSILWAQAGDLPVYNPTLNSSAFKALSYEVALASSLKYAYLNPKFPNYGNVSQALYPQISLALLGKKDPKSALSYAAQQGSRAIQSSQS